MNKETLEKANLLNDRIDELSIMKRELRPKHCNGVGICGHTPKNESVRYQFNLHSTHDSNTADKDLIMRVGINAMYNEVCRLLEFAEADLKALT
jgi:hypothetical protein